MNHILLDSVSSDNCLNVSDWITETHDEQETHFLCVSNDCLGFAMSLEQVQQAAAKLDAVLARGEESERDGEIQIDRIGVDDGCIMIAFRPAANHASRYFVFPEHAARILLARLQEMLARVSRTANGAGAIYPRL